MLYSSLILAAQARRVGNQDDFGNRTKYYKSVTQWITHSQTSFSVHSTDSKCDVSCMKLEVTGERNGYLLCFQIKGGSVLVSLMARCWLKVVQLRDCNEPVCDLDTLDLYMKL